MVLEAMVFGPWFWTRWFFGQWEAYKKSILTKQSKQESK